MSCTATLHDMTDIYLHQLFSLLLTNYLNQWSGAKLEFSVKKSKGLKCFELYSQALALSRATALAWKVKIFFSYSELLPHMLAFDTVGLCFFGFINSATIFKYFTSFIYFSLSMRLRIRRRLDSIHIVIINLEPCRNKPSRTSTSHVKTPTSIFIKIIIIKSIRPPPQWKGRPQPRACPGYPRLEGWKH